MSNAETSSREHWKPWAALALIVGATLLTFWPATRGGFVWDDDRHVTPPSLRSPSGLYRIWFEPGATQQYYPLVYSAFWLEWRCFGDDPFGYHVVNILLHAAVACLLYLLLCRLKIPGALLAALIFAVHPVCVESVAWISEEKNTLSTVFYLAALGCYLRFDEERRARYYWPALALFGAALLCKTVTASLPAAILVVLWWRRGKLSWRSDVAPLIPWFALGLALGLYTSWFERRILKAEGVDWELSFVERCLLAGRAVWFYLSELVWPANLVFFYPRWKMDAAVWDQWLFPVGVLALVLAAWLWRRRSRGPLAALLLFLGTLFPALGFFNVYPFLYSFVADHFQYLASLAIVALFSAGVASLLERAPPVWRWVGQGACVAMLVALATLAGRQCLVYRDQFTFYETILEHNPECWMAYQNLGVLYYEQGDIEKTVDNIRETLRLRPNNATARFNWGNVLLKQGQPTEAIVQYEEAIRLEPGQPRFHGKLGEVLLSLGRTREASEHYREAVRLNGKSGMYHSNLGQALALQGEMPAAIDEFNVALHLDPDNPLILCNLGDALRCQQDYPRAVVELQEALRLQPDLVAARSFLAQTRAEMGDLPAAIREGETALELAREQRSDQFIRYVQDRLNEWRAQQEQSAGGRAEPKD